MARSRGVTPRLLRRAVRALGRGPRRWAGSALLVLGALFVANGCYQVVRKPSEALGVVAPSSPKAPPGTWAAYGPLARAHSTDLMRPELLAALIQVESDGNPFARTPWVWRWSWNPFAIYAPASSAVGILQITDGAFAEARRLCIRDHAVARDGSWYDPGACWFNALYFRPVPSHAIEMTSAWLHQQVAGIVADRRVGRSTLAQRQRLAAVVHLCGRERGAAYARRGFRALPGERCGAHDLASYLERVERFRRTFARLSATG